MPLKPLKPGSRARLTDDTAVDDREPRGDDAQEQMAPLIERLVELQVALYAESKQALLVVLQGRDASGKDGLTRTVFGPLNSQGCVVSNFKRPTDYELARDYLYRVHHLVPPKGTIGIFNRSHYEDVLVVRVHGLVPKDVWSKRYEQINQFEKMLTENGVTILKFMLHISKDEQKQRLIDRLNDPLKNWKFQVGDLEERKRWADYTEAYEDALERTSTEWAPCTSSLPITSGRGICSSRARSWTHSSGWRPGFPRWIRACSRSPGSGSTNSRPGGRRTEAE
jgi:PPK2 family polyphosphate:nucleotide phosphotransferase